VSYRFRIPLDPEAGVWLVVVSAVVVAVLLAWSMLTGRSAEVEISFVTPVPVATATPVVTPEAAAPADVGRGEALVAAVASETFPPVESVIEHYFGPLGGTEDAVRVWRCETGPDAESWVGEHGELGPFQLLPEGAGKRFVDAGWNLLDARENIVAAALVVASDGWGAWDACY
jgi:hypothetical protein